MLPTRDVVVVTERKSFKKIVRVRMDRTGESYSTARRQVGARARRLPAASIKGYDRFGPGRHRESALTAHLLMQAGIEIDEVTACGLGGGIGFLYAVFDYAAMPHPLLTIVAQHHPDPWTPAVLDRLGVPYTEQHSTSTVAALGKLRAAIGDGRAALCTVDRAGLPWHGSRSHESAADPYHVVVAGAEGDTLHVDDTEPTPHPIDAEVFGAAWAAHRKGRHHLLTVGVPPERIDLRAGVADALEATVAHLTGPVLGNSFDVNFGFSGMARLAADMRDTRTRSGWARRFGTPAGFDHAMARLDECLQREYTAAGATRPVYAEFVAAAAALLGAPALDQAAALLRESGAGWSALAARAVRARGSGLPDEAPLRTLFDEMAGVVEANRATEQRATELLLDAAGGSGQRTVTRR